MSKPLRGRVRARLIPDVRRAWRFASVQIAAAGAVLLAIWPEIPPEIRAQLPYANQVGAGMMIAALIARVMKQGDRADG